MTDTSRPPWEKPVLRTLHLEGDEVLAGGCKLPNPPGGGPVPPVCYMSASSKCVNPGS
jgi:hypothetical protein